ncbi:flagellar basal body P-ring formation chaperone FlgA [Cedecea sp. NFIX57]|uniref:flagellar basal body P-ring formation chaperone FlgA n=1 Tax=Cedecea sp. NFIX57 TaxID=1566286 RepID=UPI000A0A5AE2|nr:flagellar basal body P-ring formation chaperone FlgA [Cedecea sp. NFIX57]SMG52972.1 flagella basal body P-ring formation protein FlgA [Cedecea sp. NFIX57]
MRSLKILSGIASLLVSQLALASALDGPLTEYFQQRLAGISEDVSVKVKTPEAQLPTCPQPEFSTPGNAKLWGNVSVMARCGSDKRFIQVQVIATGQYVVASRPIARGARIDANSVQLTQGRLDQLPPRTMLDLGQATDAVSLRDIAPGQPVIQTMVRQAWRVKAGQQVQVIASGEGFSVNGEGKALNNAAVAQNARVRMSSGQVVSGTVDADGNILINL